MKFSSQTIAFFDEGEGAKTQSLRGTKINDANAASASTSDGGVTASSGGFPSGTGTLRISKDDVYIVDAQQNGVVCGQVVHFDAGIGTVPREDVLGAVTCALNGGDNFEVEFGTTNEAGGIALELMDLTRDKLKLSFPNHEGGGQAELSFENSFRVEGPFVKDTPLTCFRVDCPPHGSQNPCTVTNLDSSMMMVDISPYEMCTIL